MNKVEFENALMSTIVEYISDQVVMRYMQACKKATVLFTGALIGYADAVTSLNALKEKGWKLTAVLSHSAGSVLTEKRIKDDIDPDAIYVEGAPVNGRQIVDDSQFVIIPTLTINTAAKVANCITDNLVTNMIFRAMSTGKPIVAAIDGCCPDNEVRAKMGFKVTDAYKNRMRQNLLDVQSYGIKLTSDASLCEKVEEVFKNNFEFSVADNKSEMRSAPKTTSAKPNRMLTTKVSAVETAQAATETKAAAGATSVKLDKKVIGRVDIAKNARYKTIILRSDALVTGLAKDEAHYRGIALVKE